MKLSARTSQTDLPNASARALARRAGAGAAALLDLTTSDPTRARIPYESRAILDALADPRALVHEPSPLGIASAREAAAREVGVAASRVAITASTSEAYAALFKILCDPGDEVLVPTPSYPLLGFLAAFESVVLRPYPLVYAGGWHVDRDALRQARTERTRAVVVVSPNNPTGHYLDGADLDAMLDLDLPIVSDEVFASYPLVDALPPTRRTTVLGVSRGLVFALAGLSKVAALPQMKLGWIGVGGDDALADRAMRRLELVLDAYLSVGAPVQHALPALLASRETAARAIRERTRRNVGALRRRAAASPASAASVLAVEAGWYAILRVPETRSDEEWAVRLVEEDGVHVHPGYFFDMARGAHLVVSLLTPENEFDEGVRRVLSRLAEDA